MQRQPTREEQEKIEFWKECEKNAREADLSYSYFAKKADKSVDYEIYFESAEKLIEAAKEGTIISPFARSIPFLLNSPRDFEISLNVEKLKNSVSSELDLYVAKELRRKCAIIFFDVKFPT